MYAVEKLSSYITRGVYTVSGPFHPFGGAVDIIVVQQQDGSFKSSPWYVRFGKFQGVLKAKEKVVNICVNGVEAGFHMYLDHKGEAYFLKESEAEEGDFIVSPPSSGDETDKFKQIQSCNVDDGQRELVDQMDMSNGKMVARTNSKRSRIFGLMFGRRSMKENVARASSLERAEIAADLLETKWSTNLPTNSKSIDEPSDRCGMEATVSDGEGSPQIPSSPEDFNRDQMTTSCVEGTDDGFRSSIVSKEHFEDVAMCTSSSLGAGEVGLEITTPDTRNLTDKINQTYGQTTIGINQSSSKLNESILQKPVGDSSTHGLDMVSEVLLKEKITHTLCLRTHEEILQNGTRGDDLAIRSEIISELLTTDSNTHDISSDGSFLDESAFNGESPCRAASGDLEQQLNERGGVSINISDVGNGEEEEATSLSCCQILETSDGKFNVSVGKTQEALNLSACSGEQIEHQCEALRETSYLISEGKPQSEPVAISDKENQDGCHHQDLKAPTLEDCSGSGNPQADWPSNGASKDKTTNVFCCDSPTILSAEETLAGHSFPSEVSLINSESVNTYQQREADELSQVRETSLEPMELCESQYQMNEGDSAVYSAKLPMSRFVEAFYSSEKSELESICSFSESIKSNDQLLAVPNVGEKFEAKNSCLSSGVDLPHKVGVATRPLETRKVSVPSLERPEDDHLLFNYIDSFGANGVDPVQTLKDSTVVTGDHPLLPGESDGEEHEMKDVNDDQSFESFSEVSKAQTSPIPIPRSRAHLAEPELLIRSLPIIRSHIHDLERSDLRHPISCSLNLKSEKNELDLMEKKIYGSSGLEADSKSNLTQDHCFSGTAGTAIDAENWGERKVAPVEPPVELSLCKHLLFEGMGAEAASQAFHSERVSLEKYSALGPSIVKNERLVAKIGDCYFPWVAAAPIILGMVSFGQEDIFEPQGMIAVDRAEKNCKGDATRAMVPSGGSWRLWPFTFRKSKTITTVRSVPEGTIPADLDTASMHKDLPENIDMKKSRSVKKKMPSLTPTSEELASLKLKEGSNVITFSFSTAMLGSQQVDARIYLWKWNTCVVISDVDGTITKSDVLGQFMPLVGVDWSQTGVAHLFSAIKENGYELLFLSARAISQAYLTRQFLVNLKQEGKVLPDGPVVISPDGLFPSLYREVIRRAPHEFKISCLEVIRALFPSDCNPFYAGFGNRDTDEISYLKVGIPKGKIFIINPKGEVAVNHRVDTKSYTSLHALVNGMFPPASSAELEDFNSWNYWKLPPACIDD